MSSFLLPLQKSHDADQDDADEGIKELTELALKKLVIVTVCVCVEGGGDRERLTGI